MSANQSAPPLQCNVPAKLTDEERELAIRTCAQALDIASTPALKRYWWGMMKNLIDARSAAQIGKMERAAGLRAA